MSNGKLLSLNDSMKNKDLIHVGNNKSGFFARTKIMGGYDEFKDRNGITRLGETVFETENMIVLGGSLFTLEKLFGCRTTELDNTSLHQLLGFNVGGPEESSLVNNSDDAPSYLTSDEVVCLFGVGIGGAGESFTDVANVNYPERQIFDFIPLRQTSDELTNAESEKYWLMHEEVVPTGVSKKCYYLKSFESKPEIKVLYESDEGYETGEDGAAVQSSDLYPRFDSLVGEDETQTPIETFIEVVFKISKKDVREYFIDGGEIEQTRVNTIGLFSGIKSNVSSSAGQTVYDYKRLRLFSKLNINNEMLTLPKDLTIVYRIYTS